MENKTTKHINLWYTFVGVILSLILISCTSLAIMVAVDKYNSPKDDYEYKI